MKKRSLFLSIIALIALTGCTNNQLPEINESDDDKAAETANPLNAKISKWSTVTDYINEMKYDEAEVLKYDLTGSISSPGTSDNGNYETLTVTKKTLESVESGTGNIDVLQSSDTLFPGKLILADDKLMSGSPTPVTLDRGEAKINVNLPGATPQSFKTDIYQDKVQTGIDLLCEEWGNSGYSKTSNCQFKIEQVFSRSQIDVEFGVGIGASMDIDVGYETTSSKNTFILSYKDIYFTANVSMDDKDNTIFADTVLKSDVEKAFKKDESGNTIPPLMINTCSYGKMIYFKVETTKTKDEVSAAFSYAGSVDVDVQAEFNEEMKNSSISCLVYGGTNELMYSTLTKLSGNTAATIATIFAADSKVDKNNIINYKLLSYTCNFIDNTQRSAGVVSTSKYIKTEYYTIKSQKVYLRNESGFEISQFWLFGNKISGYDQTTGTPIFEDKLTELYSSEHIPTCQERTYMAPANYGRIVFKYDIALGPHPAFDRRVSEKDFFESCDIRTCGTRWESTIKLNVDGNWQQI